MTRGMAFLFAIVMLVTQLGIGNLNVYADDLKDDVETVSSNNQVINRFVKKAEKKQAKKQVKKVEKKTIKKQVKKAAKKK